MLLSDSHLYHIQLAYVCTCLKYLSLMVMLFVFYFAQTSFGGAIYQAGGITTITGSRFISNSARVSNPDAYIGVTDTSGG